MPRRSKTKKSSSQQALRKMLKRERHLIENGTVIKVPTHPPEITSIPWNQLTVRSQNAVGLYDQFAILTLIRSQLHLTSNQGIAFRLHSARVWGGLVSFNSGPLTALRVRFYSLNMNSANPTFSGQFAVMEDVTDFPDQTRRPAVGFVWPLSQQALALTTAAPTNTPPILEITEGQASTLVYFRVWWRPTTGPYIPGILEDELADEPVPPPRMKRSLRDSLSRLSLSSSFSNPG